MFVTGNSSSSHLDTVHDRYHARDYRAVVQLLGDVPRERLLETPEHAFMLADSARRVGGISDVADLSARVVGIARAAGPSRLLCDALNLHGVVLLERGQARTAERAWFELVAVATETDNAEYVARASNNLGVAAILSMRLDEAIASFQRSVGAYRRLGYSRGLAQSHQNLGIVFREKEMHDESHAHFQRAITWAYAADSLDDVARSELETALLLLYSPEKDVIGARHSAQQALDRFAELVLPGDVAEALRVMGVVSIAEGKLQDAVQTLNASLEGAKIHKRRLLEAETLTALAAILPASKRYPLEKRADEIFSAMDAQPWGEQLRMRMAKLVPQS